MTTEEGGSGTNSIENGTSSQEKIKESLVETNQKVEASLLTAIEEYIRDHSSSKGSRGSSSGEGIDFLHVKNTLLLSYLIDLTIYLKNKLRAKKKKKHNGSHTNNNNNSSNNLRRLTEMKVVLDKVRGLDKKLRYQIDKLLQAENASTFATTTTTTAETTGPENPNAPDDPLQYRPDPKALSMDSSDSDEGDDSDDDNDENSDSDQEEEGSSDVDDDDDDDDLQAAKQTMALARGASSNSKDKNKKNKKKKGKHDDDSDDDGGDGIYKAPRHTAMPYLLDKEDKEAVKEKRKRRQMRTSELALSLRNQYGDTPEQEDYHGGTDYGKQAAAAKKFAAKEAARIQFEEDTMQRLTITRKEKKERKRIMRMEGSNLTGIADLGNLVRETNHLIGDDNDDGGRKRKGSSSLGVGGTERYSTTGKRKKEAIDRDGRPLAKRKGGKIKNSYQAALFGGGGGDGGGGSSKKKKKSKR